MASSKKHEDVISSVASMDKVLQEQQQTISMLKSEMKKMSKEMRSIDFYTENDIRQLAESAVTKKERLSSSFASGTVPKVGDTPKMAEHATKSKNPYTSAHAHGLTVNTSYTKAIAQEKAWQALSDEERVYKRHFKKEEGLQTGPIQDEGLSEGERREVEVAKDEQEDYLGYLESESDFSFNAKGKKRGSNEALEAYKENQEQEASKSTAPAGPSSSATAIYEDILATAVQGMTVENLRKVKGEKSASSSKSIGSLGKSFIKNIVRNMTSAQREKKGGFTRGKRGGWFRKTAQGKVYKKN